LETLEQTAGIALNQSEHSILSTLAYFHVFNYPCTLNEIMLKSKVQPQSNKVEQVLKSLVADQILIEKEGFYTLNIDDVDNRIQKRKKGNEHAEIALKKAQTYTKLISKFPFVRGVYLSGSLSKGVFDKDSDVDYFIVTEPKRLWICRSLLILFKKIFLLNSRKYFCVNYFIDSASLTLPDHNLFVATELTHVIPTYNYPLYLRLLEENKWIEEHYPNYLKNDGQYCITENNSYFKKMSERILSGVLGESLDNLFFKITLKRWRKKFKHISEDDFDVQMRSRKNVSKHHPAGHQKVVLQKQELILQQTISRNNILFT